MCVLFFLFFCCCCCLLIRTSWSKECDDKLREAVEKFGLDNWLLGELLSTVLILSKSGKWRIVRLMTLVCRWWPQSREVS